MEQKKEEFNEPDEEAKERYLTEYQKSFSPNKAKILSEEEEKKKEMEEEEKKVAEEQAKNKGKKKGAIKKGKEKKKAENQKVENISQLLFRDPLRQIGKTAPRRLRVETARKIRKLRPAKSRKWKRERSKK